MADSDRRTKSRNIGGGVIFKVRLTQNSNLAPSFGAITKADQPEVDPTAK
jgi:hypothetical protein